MAVIGGRNVGTNDLVVMSAGIVMFILSFFPWYGVSVKGVSGITGGSASASAWNSGFGAWFAVLLVVAVAGAAAARIFGNKTLPSVAGGSISPALIATGVSVIAVIIILLRWVTYPSGNSVVSSGAKFGLYLGLIVAIVQAVFGYLSIVAAGERLPWQQRTA